MEGEICHKANREFGLEKYTKSEICGLPTADELREAMLKSEASEVREQLASLFDDSSFVEVGAYVTRGYSDFVATKKSNELEGVICGYGAIDGKLAFVFAEDASRMGGAIDDRHAKKIVNLYDLAVKNGAPVIGIFNSNGADIFSGTAGLAAYGKIMAAVSGASGVVPQIALVTGKCIGLAASIAAMFDLTVKVDNAALYVSSPALTKKAVSQDFLLAYCADFESCIDYVRGLVSFLPMNADSGVTVESCSDNLNRMLGELDFGGNANTLIATISDNGMFYALGNDFAGGVTTALTTIGGVRCGIVANSFAENEGRIDSAIARKISKFVNFCNSFSIPVVTVVDSNGLVIDADNDNAFFAPELAKLACAYANASTPKITVINGHAIGASFVLLGSKALGADIVYATDDSEICALSAESGVAFAWDKYITLETTRESLVCEWKAEVSSPARAAASGEIDDIISVNELRARICSALLMLSAKGQNAIIGTKVLPL
ncbi:MAG: hypothetical protein E7617_02555 [Ruminococcaceae bacterium]|nr:hypothetical protein [Oscillospiraceae bacterium]